MNQYVLYARKSDEDRGNQVRSIDDQKRELALIIERESFHVPVVLEEERSAMVAGKRPEFDRMIELIRSGKVNSILVWAVHRLARNMTEGGMLQDMLTAGQIQEIRTASEVFRPGDNIMPFILSVAQAAQYSITLSADVRRGIRGKIADGQAPQRAREGYLNVSKLVGDKVCNVIDRDPERFDLIHRAWLLLLTGTHSIGSIQRIMNNEWGYTTRKSWGKKPAKFRRIGGRPIGKSTLHRIFTNPFYCGYFRHKGALVKGTHEAMITPEQFRHAQAILHRTGKQHPKRRQFAYTGLISCGNCGCRITAEVKLGNRGRTEYVYYHCTNARRTCSYRSVSLKELEQQLEDRLAWIAFDDEALAIARKNIEQINDEERGQLDAIIRKRQNRVQEARKRLEALLDLRLDGAIDTELFSKKRVELEAEIDKTIVSNPDAVLDELRQGCEEIASTCHEAGTEFPTLLPDRKRVLAQKIAASYTMGDGQLEVQYKPLLQPILQAKIITMKIEGSEPLGIGSHNKKNGHFSPAVPLGWGEGTLLEAFRQVWQLQADGSTLHSGC